MTSACAACLAECRGVYCSASCKAADELALATRGICRCNRTIEPERAAKGRKTCATCCSAATVRTMANYRMRAKRGKCGRCGEKTTKPFLTCADCRFESRCTDKRRSA